MLFTGQLCILKLLGWALQRSTSGVFTDEMKVMDSPDTQLFVGLTVFCLLI